MTDYDWIVFDSTGTLMTFAPEPARAYRDTAERFGVQLPIEEVRKNLKAAITRHFFGETADASTDENAERERWKRIVADTLTGLKGDALREAFDSLWHHFASPSAWRLYDDVLPTIDRLRSRGYSIGVASNFDGRLRNVLDGHGITNRFDAVLISSELGWSKPNTKFYDVAASRLGSIDRTQLLMIGDTPLGDVDAAVQAGWDARLLVRDSESALHSLTEDL